MRSPSALIDSGIYGYFSCQGTGKRNPKTLNIWGNCKCPQHHLYEIFVHPDIILCHLCLASTYTSANTEGLWQCNSDC